MSAFNDNPNEKKDDIERMSMADLLGMSGGEGDGRVQEREDEPGSGIARLAEMVATSSIMEAKRPSLMPTMGSMPAMPSVSSTAPPMSGSVPGSMPPMQGSMPQRSSIPPHGIPQPLSMPPHMSSIPPQGIPQPASMPPHTSSIPPQGIPPLSMPPGSNPYGGIPASTGSIPPQGGMMGMQQQPMQQQPYGYGGVPGGMVGMQQSQAIDGYGIGRAKSSSKTGLLLGIGVGAIALGAVAFFLFQGKEPPPPEDDPQLAKLQAKLDELKAQAAQPEAKPVAPAAVTEPAPSVATAAVVSPAPEVKPAEKATAGATSKKAAPKEAAAPNKPVTKTDRKRAVKTAKKITAAQPKTPKVPKEPKEETKADKDKAEADKPAAELGALLDNDVASGKKPAVELPKTPSRADVKSAMQPVQARAEKCAKYAKGTVQIKLVVTSDGRVQSAAPVGGSADQTAANCVAMISRTARFPKFKDPTFSINYPITLK